MNVEDLPPMRPMSVLDENKLIRHVNHELGTALYVVGSFEHPFYDGLEWIMNVSLVCEDCNEVLADWDRS